MRTALEVESETAQKLRQMAETQKLSLAGLLAVYIPGLAAAEPQPNGPEVEDKARAFDEWVQSFPTDAPPLSDQAISRESIYGER